MKYYYSPSSDSFYPGDFKSDYLKSSSWPIDAVQVPYEIFKEFSLNSVPHNKIRNYSEENGIYWGDKIPKDEDLAATERGWRNLELRLSDIELNKVQDADPHSVGSVSDWRNYRKELRAWPEHAEFPDSNFRPISPINKG